jgi:hypothetical protein
MFHNAAGEMGTRFFKAIMKRKKFSGRSVQSVKGSSSSPLVLREMFVETTEWIRVGREGTIQGSAHKSERRCR